MNRSFFRRALTLMLSLLMVLSAFVVGVTAESSDISKYQSSDSLKKAETPYTVPTDLTAFYGDYLHSVVLPKGFTWDSSYNRSTLVGKVGTNTFMATYTPADTINNEIVNNIPVSVTVKRAKPVFTVPGPFNATYGDMLSSIILPADDNGTFVWTVKSPESCPVGNAGVQKHNAMFIPSDNNNFVTISDIEITINVAKASATKDSVYAPVPENIEFQNKTDLKLRDIPLAAGWSWDNPDTVVTDGTPYAATYTPTDRENYDADAAEITVNVEACTHEQWGDWASNNDATFFKDGTKSRACSRCGETETQTDVGSAEYNSIPLLRVIIPFILRILNKVVAFFDSPSF